MKNRQQTLMAKMTMWNKPLNRRKKVRLVHIPPFPPKRSFKMMTRGI